MRRHRFLAALAALWFTSTITLPVGAQMGCTDKTSCGPAQACVESSCRDPIRCAKDTECGNGLGCDPEQHRCACRVDSDCGMSGTCEPLYDCKGGLCETGVCKANGQSPECGRACVENAECPGSTICTFDDSSREVGLCCQAITGTPEQGFSCQTEMRSAFSDSGSCLATITLAIVLTGRIRRRAAGRKESSAGTTASGRS